MKKAKIIVGANFGDEGKGLMTNYFCHQATQQGESCITVLHNGGAQRGHTVEYLNGLRHVFKHFGSGTFEKIPTYLSQDFILNPIIFHQEWEELVKMGFTPEIYVDYRCRITTPFDMMLNQIIEESRGNFRHGSCGLGIYETILRYENNQGARLNDFVNLDDCNKIIEECKNAKKFLYQRTKQLKITETLKDWKNILGNFNIIDRYVDDFCFMLSKIKSVVDHDLFLQTYDTVVFENGQGLMLDMDNREYFPNLTPSHTGLYNPIKLLLKTVGSQEYLQKIGIEVCYVTRSYITRHGAGRLDRECSKDTISQFINDKTNITNSNQGALRFAKLDTNELYNRVIKDFEKNLNTKNGLSHKISLALTHLNEYKIKPLESFDKIYYSYSPYVQEVESY